MSVLCVCVVRVYYESVLCDCSMSVVCECVVRMCCESVL